jgi:hypothetical protein
MSSSRNLGTSHAAISHQRAREVRARAWIFVLESYMKKAAPDRRPDDGTESKEDSASGPIIQ